MLREIGSDEAPPPRAGRPFERWPSSPSEWQDELRRLLQQPKAPPEPPPVIITQPRQQVSKSLPKTLPSSPRPVEPRKMLRPQPQSVARAGVPRWTRDPKALREAFIAAVVLSPPLGLREPDHPDPRAVRKDRGGGSPRLPFPPPGEEIGVERLRHDFRTQSHSPNTMGFNRDSEQ